MWSSFSNLWVSPAPCGAASPTISANSAIASQTSRGLKNPMNPVRSTENGVRKMILTKVMPLEFDLGHFNSYPRKVEKVSLLMCFFCLTSWHFRPPHGNAFSGQSRFHNMDPFHLTKPHGKPTLQGLPTAATWQQPCPNHAIEILPPTPDDHLFLGGGKFQLLPEACCKKKQSAVHRMSTIMMVCRIFCQSIGISTIVTNPPSHLCTQLRALGRLNACYMTGLKK